MQNYGKIVILGAGHVGSHCAMALAGRGICHEVVLVDIDKTKAKAQAMDVTDALTFPPVGVIVRDGSYAECADADIIVVAIGETRLPGQTRLDMLDHSVRMLYGMVEELNKVGISGLVITITNPADIVADYVRRGLGYPRERAFGTGTLLDTARLIRTVSEMTGISRASINAFSMGEHGNSSMIPFSQMRIGGRDFESFPHLSKDEILGRTRAIGMELLNYKNCTEFGIGQVLSELCSTIFKDEKRILPLSVLLEGEYGQHEVHCGVPCRVGRNGIEDIIEFPLTDEEQALLDRSCQIIKKHIAIGQEIAPLKVK